MEQDETRENGSAPDAVAALMRVVGRRQEPPREAYDAVFVAAQQALRQQVAARRQRHLAGWAIAASVVVAAVVALLMPRNPVTGRTEIVATVGRVVGSVELGTESGWRPMAESGR